MEKSRADSDDEDSVLGVEHEPEVVIRTATLYLKEYAATKGHSLHSISQMPPEQLADYLKDFYTTVKFKDLVATPAVSLKYLRTGLHRYFMKEHDIDILNDHSFEHANKVFEVTSRSTPRRCHRLRIEFDDLRKIYMGQAMLLDQPDTLQNKVFFDVNLYICNRGKDFLRVMAKDDFVISSDPDGRRYVWLKYHPKFSFRELVGGVGEADLSFDGNQIGERMYERRGDVRCPVTSFLLYLTHLHPMTEAFWQRPKRSFVHADYVWFDNTPLGNSTLSRIMTRICQSAGLFENYTNHAIKNSYIPVIENLCKMANKKPVHDLKESRSGSPAATVTQGMKDVDDGTTDSGSICSDAKDMECDDGTLGLQQAKMKVLEMVHGLDVKDIRAFVDWMKTFRAEMDGGGLVVLCSPVNQAAAEKDTKSCGTTKGSNSSTVTNGGGGDVSRGGSPVPTASSNRQLSPTPTLKSKPNLNKLQKDGSQEDSGDFGIAIKQLDFDCVGNSYSSTSEVSPVKVTIPCQDTVLLTGLQDSVQLLIHNREGPPLVSEPTPSRIFYSQHEMDVAVAIALLSTRNSIKSSLKSLTGHDKAVHFSKLEDKFKPMKKRSLTDLHAVGSKEDYEVTPNKRKSTGSGNYTMISVPTSVPKVTSTVAHPSQAGVHNVPVFSQFGLDKGRLVSAPSIHRGTNQTSLLSNRVALPKDMKIKKEPVDKF